MVRCCAVTGRPPRPTTGLCVTRGEVRDRRVHDCHSRGGGGLLASTVWALDAWSRKFPGERDAWQREPTGSMPCACMSVHGRPKGPSVQGRPSLHPALPWHHAVVWGCPQGPAPEGRGNKWTPPLFLFWGPFTSWWQLARKTALLQLPQARKVVTGSSRYLVARSLHSCKQPSPHATNASFRPSVPCTNPTPCHFTPPCSPRLHPPVARRGGTYEGLLLRAPISNKRPPHISGTVGGRAPWVVHLTGQHQHARAARQDRAAAGS